MHACKAEDFYSDIIAQPPSRKTVSNRETEVQTEDEQAFLGRQQQLLMQGKEPTRGESPMRSSTPGGGKTPRTPGQQGQGSPNKKVCNSIISICNRLTNNITSDRSKAESRNSERRRRFSKLLQFAASQKIRISRHSRRSPKLTRR